VLCKDKGRFTLFIVSQHAGLLNFYEPPHNSNMLDMHRANSNQLELQCSHVDVKQDILLPVASMLYSRGCGFEILVDCEPEHLVVMADKLRLRQIILNLSRNAVKVSFATCS
jgi:signal transduction histidine kinase